MRPTNKCCFSPISSNWFISTIVKVLYLFDNYRYFCKLYFYFRINCNFGGKGPKFESLHYFPVNRTKTGPEVIKLFSCSTELSTKFIMLINVKMPTIVGILTFMRMINTISERLKSRNFFICRYFSNYEQLKFCAQFEFSMKKVL